MVLTLSWPKQGIARDAKVGVFHEFYNHLTAFSWK